MRKRLGVVLLCIACLSGCASAQYSDAPPAGDALMEAVATGIVELAFDALFGSPREQRGSPPDRPSHRHRRPAGPVAGPLVKPAASPAPARAPGKPHRKWKT